MNLNQVKKLMERKKTSRKGENGRALIIGGSPEYVGALTLAGLGALRAGCDVVTIAAEKFDAVLIGNGITRKADKFCQYFIKKSPRPKVIDADALKSLSFKDFSNSILTPHETELEMMLVNSNK